jgi:2-methylisocitrate lyase-like PEP mutase family enzyme
MPTLLERLATGESLAVAGVSDTLSAKVVEQAGFDAIWLGSVLGSASTLGNADVGLMSAEDRLDQLRKIRAISSLPVFIDGEEGWGDAPQVAYWTRQFAREGAAGIMFTDKTGDFVTPYIEGTTRDVVSVDVATRKYRAAADAKPSDFILIARSSAIRTMGMDEQLKRLAAYKEAGADVLWATSSHPDSLRQYRAGLEGPIWSVCNPHSGAQAQLTLDEFRELGIQMVAFELGIYLVGLRAMIDAAKELRATGGIGTLIPRMTTFEEFLSLSGYDEMAAVARRYGVIP